MYRPVNILDYMKDNLVYLDGGMGTLLQERGLMPGELPERWNITHPGDIIDIHRAYFDAGSNIVMSNTFGANIFKFEAEELDRIIFSAVENVRRAAHLSRGTQEKFAALDIGPLGKLLKPYGELSFEAAVEAYARTVRAGVKAGADLIFIETMNDSCDTRAAVIAAKENSGLPVFVSNAYGEDGKLMTGASPAAMTAMLEGLSVDALGANCSLGPKELRGVVEEYLKVSSTPVLLKPNAGLPRTENGRTVYDVHPEEFSELIAEYVKMGVRLCGGCCGTSPAFIERIVEKTKDLKPLPVTEKGLSVVSSAVRAVYIGKAGDPLRNGEESSGYADPVLIGERINPTGKKRFKEALRNEDLDYILSEGIRQQENGAHILDVNVGIPEIDEPALLKRVCYELQGVTDLPLQIDTADISAMEGALRIYNGKALINSVSGKEEVMRGIFPLVKKYGGIVVCLTLDEEGIPESADRRVEIASHIIETAAEYGIKKKDLIFDTLTMSVSADAKASLSTLGALKRISSELGCNTVLGVSNISFGLPDRDAVNSVFFSLALENGLSAAIMNPGSERMMKAYHAFRVLKGLDKNCEAYIENAGRYRETVPVKANEAPVLGNGDKDRALERTYGEAFTGPSEGKSTESGPEKELERAIIKGLKEKAASVTKELLKERTALSIVNEQIIPALDTVGQGFEKKTLFLPQLLMSAEAAKAAFMKIKLHAGEGRVKEGAEAEVSVSRGKFVIATVHGDVHDIGKNIVSLILENYGFEVIDLGKDVPAEVIADAVVRERAPLVGLSALMTTTVPAMEETIKLLRKRAPFAKIVVGGAVLTKEYADMIGADFYAKDAMATVRYSIECLS